MDTARLLRSLGRITILLGSVNLVIYGLLGHNTVSYLLGKNTVLLRVLDLMMGISGLYMVLSPDHIEICTSSSNKPSKIVVR